MSTDFFLDTNVLIGYCFPDDRWHTESSAVLRKTGHFHTSETVVSEFDYRFRENIASIPERIGRHVADFKRHLLKAGLPEEIDVTRIAKLQNTVQGYGGCPIQIKRCFLELLEDLKPMCNRDILFERLSRLPMDLETSSFGNGSTVTGSLVVHRRSEDYPSIRERLSNILKDHPNVENNISILLDVHDLAVQSQIVELVFVTGDKKHFVDHKDEILQEIHVKRIVDLSYEVL
ncbi:MAG: hypothetical protein ACE5KV_08800, partial [Thermoplasmata archaeon]